MPEMPSPRGAISVAACGDELCSVGRLPTPRAVSGFSACGVSFSVCVDSLSKRAEFGRKAGCFVISAWQNRIFHSFWRFATRSVSTANFLSAKNPLGAGKCHRRDFKRFSRVVPKCKCKQNRRFASNMSKLSNTYRADTSTIAAEVVVLRDNHLLPHAVCKSATNRSRAARVPPFYIVLYHFAYTMQCIEYLSVFRVTLACKKRSVVCKTFCPNRKICLFPIAKEAKLCLPVAVELEIRIPVKRTSIVLRVG